jgi:hypothetical protein
VAAISPSSAILESFALLEAQLREKLWPVLAEHVGSRVRAVSMRQMTQIAREEAVLTPAEAKSINELATLRNALAHGQGRDVLDPQRAYSYLDVVDRLAKIIDNAVVRTPNRSTDGGSNQGYRDPA